MCVVWRVIFNNELRRWKEEPAVYKSRDPLSLSLCCVCMRVCVCVCLLYEIIKRIVHGWQNGGGARTSFREGKIDNHQMDFILLSLLLFFFLVSFLPFFVFVLKKRIEKIDTREYNNLREWKREKTVGRGKRDKPTELNNNNNIADIDWKNRVSKSNNTTGYNQMFFFVFFLEQKI